MAEEAVLEGEATVTRPLPPGILSLSVVIAHFMSQWVETGGKQVTHMAYNPSWWWSVLISQGIWQVELIRGYNVIRIADS